MSCVALTNEAAFVLGVRGPDLVTHRQGNTTEVIGADSLLQDGRKMLDSSLWRRICSKSAERKEQILPSPLRLKKGTFGTDKSNCRLVLLAKMEYEGPDLPSYPKHLKTWKKYMKLKKKNSFEKKWLV